MFVHLWFLFILLKNEMAQTCKNDMEIIMEVSYQERRWLDHASLVTLRTFFGMR